MPLKKQKKMGVIFRFKKHKFAAFVIMLLSVPLSDSSRDSMNSQYENDKFAIFDNLMNSQYDEFKILIQHLIFNQKCSSVRVRSGPGFGVL